MGSYKVSEAKMNVMLIFLVLCIRFATNYFFKASNGIWWPVFVTVLHLTWKDCRKLSFSRVTCCFDWLSSHFDSWQCFQNFVFSPKKIMDFPCTSWLVFGTKTAVNVTSDISLIPKCQFNHKKCSIDFIRVSSHCLVWSFESIKYCLTVFWNKNCCECDKHYVFDTEMSFWP